MKEALGIIPARYHSRRFPGKALALINNKPMIQRVYEQATTSKYLNRVIVATDDQRIYAACQAIGAEVWLTSPDHHSGTERAAEVAAQIKAPIIINIQGDEPLIQGEMIDSLVAVLEDEAIPIATLAAKVNDLSLLTEENIVKVVVDRQGFALYFSRSPLPYHPPDYFLQHIGLYGYQRDFLLKFQSLKPSRLEKIERLEQLRALDNGYRIKILEFPFPTLSVDTPQDIIKVENYLKEKKDE